jgi:NAD+ synthetase
MLDYEKVFITMVTQTKQYLEDNNLFAMILGISGGLDSTVTAAICHEVENRNPDIKFIGINLPCTSNNQDENDSAEMCMKAFCKENHYYTENLQKEYMLMKATCAQRHIMTTIGAGNIKARLRMITLYNEANYFSGCVMDTDNLTEHYLGFFTIHGDVGDYNPIGGLWKHEVYGLAKWIREYYHKKFMDPIGPKVDVETITKYSKMVDALDAAIGITPTDGNGVKAGGDMAQIAPAFVDDVNVNAYKKVDKIIKTYLEQRYLPGAIENLYEEFGQETVDGVINRIKRTQFKRDKLPVVIDRALYV